MIQTERQLRKIIKEEIEAVMVGDTGPEIHGSTKDPDGYEGRMFKQNLAKIAEYAQKLLPLIEDDENIEPWVQDKIAVAADVMDSVGHYVQYEKKNQNGSY